MQTIFKLSKEDIEYIIIEYFQHKGLEPNVKMNKDGSCEVEVEYDMESFNDNF